MNHVISNPPAKLTHARTLCEQSAWGELVDFALDWQLETPGDASAFFYQGVALTALGRPKEAESSYRRALQLDPQHFKVWNNLALLLFEILQRRAEGVNCLAQAMQLDPANPLGWANLASMNGQLGRHALALEHAERALALDPEMVEAQLHRARAAQVLRRTDILADACNQLGKLPTEKFKRAR